MQHLLSVNGVHVTSALTAEGAIEVLRRQRVDAIVLDVRMPGRSGLDVLRFVRRQEELRDTPVLILTGARLSVEEEALIAAHRAYVFYKTENLELLALYVARLTNQSRAITTGASKGGGWGHPPARSTQSQIAADA